MPLIWGFEQRRGRAADWHDGQSAHGAHAYFARRATVRVIARERAKPTNGPYDKLTSSTGQINFPDRSP
jgi:hypothetical protein